MYITECYTEYMKHLKLLVNYTSNKKRNLNKYLRKKNKKNTNML